jgi:transposase-like protein
MRAALAQCEAEEKVTCQRCKVPMKEVKGHIYHKKRKWKCPQCKRVRMQQPKPAR